MTADLLHPQSVGANMASHTADPLTDNTAAVRLLQQQPITSSLCSNVLQTEATPTAFKPIRGKAL